MKLTIQPWWAACVLLGVSLPAWADCSKDTDCKGARICESGKCVNPPAAASSPEEPSAPPPAPMQPTQPPPPERFEPPTGGYEPFPYNGNSYEPMPYSPYGPPHARYMVPPPLPPEPYHRLALRLGVSGGLQATGNDYGDSVSRLGFGLSGGIGVYTGYHWGIMAASSWDPLYPSAVIVDGELFNSNRWLWASVGLGWGNFRQAVGSSRVEGLAVTGNVYFKLEPQWGLGVQIATVDHSSFQGSDSFFRMQLGLAYLY